jgi:hypothetical protein
LKERIFGKKLLDLKLFRNLRRFEMSDAKRCDVPTGWPLDGFSTRLISRFIFRSRFKNDNDWKEGKARSLLLDPDFIADLKLLITSDSSVVEPELTPENDSYKQ